MPHPWIHTVFLEFLSLAHCFIFLCPFWPWGLPGGVRVSSFPLNLLPQGLSFSRASRHTSSIHRLVLGGYEKRNCSFPFATNVAHSKPSRCIALKNQQISSCITLPRLPRISHSPLRLFFPVNIFDFSLSQNRTFCEAYTDTFIPHAAVFKNPRIKIFLVIYSVNY